MRSAIFATMKWEVTSENELVEIAKHVVAAHKEPVILFKGEMGAGKTTFIKTICKALDITDEVSSPTFSIVNEYYSPVQDRVFHFDFYRLEDEEEAYDFGYEEYLFSGQICLVEWPEKISNLLPQKFGLIEIVEHDGKRSIEFTPSTTTLP